VPRNGVALPLPPRPRPKLGRPPAINRGREGAGEGRRAVSGLEARPCLARSRGASHRPRCRS
jgi:hypothetical protein